MNNPILDDNFGSGIDNSLYEEYDYFSDKILNNLLPKSEDISYIDDKKDYSNNIEDFKTRPTQKEPTISINDKEINNFGKKTRNSKSKVHDKYCSDNIYRKINSALKSNLISFINDKIYLVYKGKIGQGILKKEFKSPQNQIKNIKDNQKFINKKLKEILSVDIKGSYSNYPNNHNKKLINILLNEKDEEKKNLFEKLFNLTFLECLNHFAQKNYIKELDGLKTLNETFTKDKNDSDYLKLLQYSAENYEEILSKKKSRKKKMKRIINN